MALERHGLNLRRDIIIRRTTPGQRPRRSQRGNPQAGRNCRRTPASRRDMGYHRSCYRPNGGELPGIQGTGSRLRVPELTPAALRQASRPSNTRLSLLSPPATSCNCSGANPDSAKPRRKRLYQGEFGRPLYKIIPDHLKWIPVTRLFPDHAVTVPVVHVRIRRMVSAYRRDAVLPRFPARSSAIAVASYSAKASSSPSGKSPADPDASSSGDSHPSMGCRWGR